MVEIAVLECITLEISKYNKEEEMIKNECLCSKILCWFVTKSNVSKSNSGEKQ